MVVNKGILHFTLDGRGREKGVCWLALQKMQACSHCRVIVTVIVLVQYVISHSIPHALNSVYIGAL